MKTASFLGWYHISKSSSPLDCFSGGGPKRPLAGALGWWGSHTGCGWRFERDADA